MADSFSAIHALTIDQCTKHDGTPTNTVDQAHIENWRVNGWYSGGVIERASSWGVCGFTFTGVTTTNLTGTSLTHVIQSAARTRQRRAPVYHTNRHGQYRDDEN